MRGSVREPAWYRDILQRKRGYRDNGSQAAQKALEDAGMKAEEIDLIIVATISPTEIMPCVACGVQEQIGAENATCFDLNGACTGSLLALNTAQAYLAQEFTGVPL